METSYERYGIQCKEGWAKLYKPLIDLCNLYGVTINQIKEKFGTLRFYVGFGPDAVVIPYSLDAIIAAARNASSHTCEFCGEDGIAEQKFDDFNKNLITTYKATTSGKGWIKTLCAPCRKVFDDRP